MKDLRSSRREDVPDRPDAPATESFGDYRAAAVARPAPDPAARAVLAAQQDLLLRLLFDHELRERFAADREGALRAEGLCAEAGAAFATLDLRGLELDAGMRRGYLMAALCRPYPLSAAAVGAMRGGPRRLSRFLSARALRGSLSERTRAFGSFLGGVLEENEPGAPEVVLGLVRAFLDLERERASTAASLRQAVEEGHEPPRPSVPSNNRIKHGRLVLPAHFLAAELPVPTSVMAAALHQVTPENAWSLIEGGTLALERLESVARAEEIPATVLSRAVLAGRGLERAGAGGVSPIVEVAHRTVELTGRRGAVLSAFDGTRRMADLPPPLAAMARSLLEAGLLEVTPD